MNDITISNGVITADVKTEGYVDSTNTKTYVLATKGEQRVIPSSTAQTVFKNGETYNFTGNTVVEPVPATTLIETPSNNE